MAQNKNQNTLQTKMQIIYMVMRSTSRFKWMNTKEFELNKYTSNSSKSCTKGPKMSHRSYNYETWQSYTLPKDDPKKNMNHVTRPLCSADISIFSTEIRKYC